MSLLVGSEGPVALRVTVRRAPGSDLDFSTLISASIGVRLPKETLSPDESYVFETWMPSIDPVDEKETRLLYVFASGGVDLPRVGLYSLSIDLTFPSGVVPCTPTPLSVADRY